jgi:DNA-directed RNA polymerase subunit K/omega
VLRIAKRARQFRAGNRPDEDTAATSEGASG